jgi:predicted N-formylglutamate amidohydrolase
VADAAPDPDADTPLLGEDDPAPVIIERPDGASPILLCCDHAGNAVPARLNGLGLPPAALDRHIGYDIGVLGLALGLAERLDAMLVAQRYSRLVIDCNRLPSQAASIPQVIDGTAVPANQGLQGPARRQREREILTPYHTAIGQELDRRTTAAHPIAMVSLHSFTPTLAGLERPWQLGVIHGEDETGADAFFALLEETGAADRLSVGRNQPYAVEMDVDFTLPVHAEERGLPYIELEVRQDLIADAAGQADWAARLAALLGPWADRVLG